MILCEKCHKVLDSRSPEKTQYKICMGCVQEEHSHMIIKPKEEPINGKEKEKSNVDLTIEYVKMDYRYFLEIIATPNIDIKKGVPIRIGLSKQQLETFLEEMKVLRKQDKDA